ncbi:MarR family winged helix-turn-helix transcriptional regulator [Streptomyces sp. WAC06614]|uniref:MarR family winged helix-turn-helix transcriptional regulator n=1 Tax=Streptomyces sp. WAC06614 TaxID=2487416 RepID=UPI000F773EBE|nr:MarR family transcriptional regulator [Streptomyces sp. WAC06614]RSS83032.1 MarR family transcriptional regulator [Streptomyces sp. WAC06614]
MTRHATRPRASGHLHSLPSWLLGRLAARGRAEMGRALAAEGLRPPHHAVLAAVAEDGPVAQADLGRRLAIDPKDLVGILNHLEDRGLALRTPDPRDRRKNAVTLTRAGAKVLRRCTALAEEANAALLAPLAPAEQATLTELLARLYAAGRAADERGGQEGAGGERAGDDRA